MRALFLASSAMALAPTAHAQVECNCSKIVGECGGGLRVVSQQFKPANSVTRDLAEIHWVVELNAGQSPPKCALVSGSVEGAGAPGMNSYTEIFGRNIYKKVVMNGVPVQIADYQKTTRESATITYSGFHTSCKVCEAKEKEGEQQKKEREGSGEKGSVGSAVDPVAAALAQQSSQTTQQMNANAATGYVPPNQLSAAERRRRAEVLMNGARQASALARTTLSGSYGTPGQASGDGAELAPCPSLDSAVREMDLSGPGGFCDIAIREQQAAARIRSAASSCSAAHQQWAVVHVTPLETHAAEVLRDSCGK